MKEANFSRNSIKKLVSKKFSTFTKKMDVLNQTDGSVERKATIDKVYDNDDNSMEAKTRPMSTLSGRKSISSQKKIRKALFSA
jgi:hypothetical protein